MKLLSFFSLSEAYSSARPSCLTASSTISRSYFNACFSANQLFWTASHTTEMVLFKLSEAYCNANPFCWTASSTISLSSSSAGAYCSANPFCFTAYSTISVLFFIAGEVYSSAFPFFSMTFIIKSSSSYTLSGA